MPFFQYNFKNIKKYIDCVSLQVQSHIKAKLNNNLRGKRVCPFTSKGSITIEAAISITLFAGIIYFVMGFIMMINTTFMIQMKMNNIATITAKSKFYVNLANEAVEYSKSLKKLKKEIEEIKNKISYTGISSDIKNVCYKEQNSVDRGEIDIILNYALKTPILNKFFAIKQRSFVKDWTGKDITVSHNIVYITENGRVYHTTRECSHLVIKISKAVFSKINSLTNAYGEKYDRCFICVKSSLHSGDKIFITEDGKKYHGSLTCSGLTRNVIAVEKDSVGDMPLCSGCAKGE